VALYVISTLLYPGGSQYSPTTKGFNWLHNYWCDLTAATAKNGAINSARPIALAGMVVLCLALAVFWYHVPALAANSRDGRIIRYAGILSMLIAIVLFTDLHDVVINVAGSLGIMALALTYNGLYKSQQYALFIYGLVCLAAIFTNYIIYQTGAGKLYLPVVQKITFLLFLSWIGVVNIYVYRRKKLLSADQANQ
jgi:hypothetical protein